MKESNELPSITFIIVISSSLSVYISDFKLCQETKTLKARTILSADGAWDNDLTISLHKEPTVSLCEESTANRIKVPIAFKAPAAIDDLPSANFTHPTAIEVITVIKAPTTVKLFVPHQIFVQQISTSQQSYAKQTFLPQQAFVPQQTFVPQQNFVPQQAFISQHAAYSATQ